MLHQPRRGVAAGDQDVGKTLVVAQQHVVARLELLDEIGFEQQRLGLGLGGDEHHRAGLGDHAGDADRLPLRRRVGLHPLLDRARLADIEHLAVGPDHAVDARPVRRVLPERLDHRRAARQRPRLGRRFFEREVERRRSVFALRVVSRLGRIEAGDGGGWLGRAVHRADLG